MNGIIKSGHSKRRCQQCCVNDIVIQLLLYYGESRKCRGGVDGLFFSKDSMEDISNEHGNQILKMCEKFRNTYLILSEDGVVITVARSYRTIH